MNFWLDILPPVVVALLIWWGATGVIIYLCGRQAWRPWVFWAVTAIQPVAWWRLWAEKSGSEVGSVFASFFWAVLIWAWIETSYYSGFIVGRRLPELEPDAPTGLRFRQAIQANLYHELSILTLSLIVVVVGWGGANETGLWAFMILHWTHQSAKINIFLGVSNLTTEYLPDNLKYMAQYFSQKSLNMFFPFSVTATTVLATGLFASILSASSSGQAVGQTLLFVMMAAAILEHWWLVTPIPSRMWEWALKSRRTEPTPLLVNTVTSLPPNYPKPEIASPAPNPIYNLQSAIYNPPPVNQPTPDPRPLTPSLPAVHVLCGYLGSGKTTVIRELLPQLPGRVAVIVNDFGTIGVDAELIRSVAPGGSEAVIELPGGCVCCTLQKNLAGQIVKLLQDYGPERILIEPSGVAGIEEIVRTLASPRLVGRLGAVEVIAVVDAPRLLTPTGLQKFTLTQIKAAGAVIVSKTDLISPAETATVLNLVSTLNPLARLFPAVEGRLSAVQLFNLGYDDDHDATTEESDHDRHDHSEGSGLISFAREYNAIFDPTALKILFDRLAAGYFGPIERAKGLFPLAGGNRQAWDLAGGRVFCRLVPSTVHTEPMARFMLVAQDLATDDLNQTLENCIIVQSKLMSKQ